MTHDDGHLFPVEPVEREDGPITLADRLADALGVCDWPDGGCGKPILRIPSATSGKTLAVDAHPDLVVQRVVIGEPIDGRAGSPLVVGPDPASHVGPVAGRVLKTYVAHQANCGPYQAMLARRQTPRRAARADKERPS
jgi:hypothetical protein